MDRCRHYVDIIWYFLKSTDKLLDVRNDCVSFKHEDGKQFVGVEVDYTNNWSIKINANVHPGLLVESSTPGSIVIENFKNRPARGSKGLRWVTGKATPKDDLLLNFARGCFAAAGYWYDDSDA